MKLNEEQQKEVREWLERKREWGTKCGVCGKDDWQISDSIFQLMEFNQNGFHVGGPVQPIISVICAYCGNTILLNAIIAGAITPKPKGVKNG